MLSATAEIRSYLHMVLGVVGVNAVFVIVRVKNLQCVYPLESPCQMPPFPLWKRQAVTKISLRTPTSSDNRQ